MSRSKVKCQGHHGQKRSFRRISRESLKRFATNSHGRRVWPLARTSLKVKVKIKGQGHQEQKTAFLALSAACVRFMFGKTSLAFISLHYFVFQCESVRCYSPTNHCIYIVGIWVGDSFVIILNTQLYNSLVMAALRSRCGH